MTNALGSIKTVLAFSHSNAMEGLSSFTNPAGNTVVQGMPVFKSGTFKDSMGNQNTWETQHLEQMVFNFGMLRDRGVFPNVPVRDGHRSPFGGGGQVIGYVTNLSHDATTGRLLADYEITEPDAAAKIARGTLRGRSAEIGMYETNDEASYWPVFQGFAFVDIPAVEGLYSKADDNEFVIMTEQKEHSVTEEQPQGAPAEGTPPVGQPGENHPASPNPAPVVPATEPIAGTHSAPASVATFSINGTPTTDFAAVQAHITALETAQSEQRDTGRRAYVSALANDRKITQPQVEALTTVALSMDDTQFAAFRAAYDAAPTQSLLDVHAGPTDSAHAATTQAEHSEMSTLEETLAMHRRSGIPEAQIEKMPSFIRLQALKSQNPKG